MAYKSRRPIEKNGPGRNRGDVRKGRVSKARVGSGVDVQTRIQAIRAIKFLACMKFLDCVADRHCIEGFLCIESHICCTLKYPISKNTLKNAVFKSRSSGARRRRKEQRYGYNGLKMVFRECLCKPRRRRTPNHPLKSLVNKYFSQQFERPCSENKSDRTSPRGRGVVKCQEFQWKNLRRRAPKTTGRHE